VNQATQAINLQILGGSNKALPQEVHILLRSWWKMGTVVIFLNQTKD